MVSNLGTLLMVHDLAFGPQMHQRPVLRQQNEHYWFRADLNPCNEVDLTQSQSAFTLRLTEPTGLNGFHGRRNYRCLHLVFDRTQCTLEKEPQSLFVDASGVFWVDLSSSHTGLTIRLRPTCDRKMLESWANRIKNLRLVAEVMGDRHGRISRSKVDGHVQNF